TTPASNQAELPGRSVNVLAIQPPLQDSAVTSINRQRSTASATSPASTCNSASVGTDDNSMRDSRTRTRISPCARALFYPLRAATPRPALHEPGRSRQPHPVHAPVPPDQGRTSGHAAVFPHGRFLRAVL